MKFDDTKKIFAGFKHNINNRLDEMFDVKLQEQDPEKEEKDKKLLLSGEDEELEEDEEISEISPVPVPTTVTGEPEEEEEDISPVPVPTTESKLTKYIHEAIMSVLNEQLPPLLGGADPDPLIDLPPGERKYAEQGATAAAGREHAKGRKGKMAPGLGSTAKGSWNKLSSKDVKGRMTDLGLDMKGKWWKNPENRKNPNFKKARSLFRDRYKARKAKKGMDAATKREIDIKTPTAAARAVQDETGAQAPGVKKAMDAQGIGGKTGALNRARQEAANLSPEQQAGQDLHTMKTGGVATQAEINAQTEKHLQAKATQTVNDDPRSANMSDADKASRVATLTQNALGRAGLGRTFTPGAAGGTVVQSDEPAAAKPAAPAAGSSPPKAADQHAAARKKGGTTTVSGDTTTTQGHRNPEEEFIKGKEASGYTPELAKRAWDRRQESTSKLQESLDLEVLKERFKKLLD